MTVSSSFDLDSINLSFLPSDDGSSFKGLPLVITPRSDSSLDFLSSWLEINRSFVNDMLTKYGAVLVRGFNIDSSSDFEKATLSLQPNLNNCYRGTSPRNLQKGTSFVFSAAEVPANYPIAQHLEMSFLPAPPRHLYFSCMKAPTSSGGETALCDFRQVYRDLDPQLRQKLFDKGIRYTRTQKKVGSYFTFDVSDMVGWPEIYDTSDKEEVEKLCAKEGTPVQWEGPNKDTFVSITQSQPFQVHPITKEPVWFNHIQVFHWTTFPMELFYSFRRTLDPRLLLHCILVSIFCIINYGILGNRMSLETTFGDGTPISVREMQLIRSTIHTNLVFNRWSKGDILCLDNFSTSHGRQPTYDRGRKVVVAWSEPFEKTNTFAWANHATSATQDFGENPQERSPESTLTKEGSLESSRHDSLSENTFLQEVALSLASKK
jgi:hypothetical protein